MVLETVKIEFTTYDIVIAIAKDHCNFLTI